MSHSRPTAQLPRAVIPRGSWILPLAAAMALTTALASGSVAAATAATDPTTSTAAAPTDTPATDAAAATAPDASAPAAADAAPNADAAASGAPPEEFRSLDSDVQDLKKEVLDLNKDLFVLEEELLFPANTQVAVYVSLDVGTFFNVDSVTLKVDNKEVANYLYTAREAEALLKGGVHRIFIGNLKVGKHELVAFFSGKGPHERDYKRGATLNFEKGVGAKYLELKISDRLRKLQPEFIIKEWE
jgi:hypothetical protein